MKPENGKKRQNLKVIISEAIMVISVVAMVAVLALLVSGYWINSDLEIERQGMVQVNSYPTGADIQIDGESNWLFRTDASKVLKSGTHTISLSKAGYDQWSKEINISEGLLYRLRYPRLFLQERTPEKVYTINSSALSTVSPNYNKILVIDTADTWQLIELNSNSLTTQTIDMSNVFSANTTIKDILWSGDSNHVLAYINIDGLPQWVMVDLKKPAGSINLTTEFNSTFSQVKIIDNSANNILVVKDGNLHKIDIARKQISAVLIKNIIDFDHLDDHIIFSARSEQGQNYIATLDGDQINHIADTQDAAQVALGEFYDEKYYAVLSNSTVSAYKLSSDEEIFSHTIDPSLSDLAVKGEGSVVTVTSGSHIVAVDMESSKDKIEWDAETINYHWLNDFMFYSIKDGELKVYDYDGLNARSLADGVSSSSTVTISNNKWLYYIKDNALTREKIAD